MTSAQLTSTDLCASLSSHVLVQAVDSIGEEILATGADEGTYYDNLCLAFDTIVAELTARGLWLGEDS